MIELLILYSLKNKERTLYSLRADIIEKFGYFTKPSIGTIYPALKRLLKDNTLTIRNDYSQGGKKSTFYSLSLHYMKKFTDFFFTPISDNPTAFFTEIQARIAVMSMLEDDLKLTFLNDALIKLESYVLDLKNMLEDEYVDYDFYQNALLKKNIADVEGLKSLLTELKS